MITPKPLLAQLKHAVRLAEQIESLQAELAATMRSYWANVGDKPATGPKAAARKGSADKPAPTRKTRVNRVSPEGRAKIAEAQQRRWAKWRKA